MAKVRAIVWLSRKRNNKGLRFRLLSKTEFATSERLSMILNKKKLMNKESSKNIFCFVLDCDETNTKKL